MSPQPNVSSSVVLRLHRDWDNGILTELGVRIPVFSRASVRGGVGILRTFHGKTRVNPTIGFDVRLGTRQLCHSPPSKAPSTSKEHP